MQHEEVSQLTDQQLLSRTRELVQYERDHNITIIHHLREIRERGLHLERGYSSLFDYAVKALRYSDGAAYRRLQTLKLCEGHPEVEERLRSGALSLTTAAQLQRAIEQREKRRKRERQQDRASEPGARDTAASGPSPAATPQPELTFQPQPRPEPQPASAASAQEPASAPQPRPVSQSAVHGEQPATTTPAPVSAPAGAPQPQAAFDRQAAPAAAVPVLPPQPRPAAESPRPPEAPPASAPEAVPEAARNRDLINLAEGQSSRQVARLIANLDPQSAPPRERLRCLGGGRWELRVVVDDSCHAGLEQLRALLSHLDPVLSYGRLLARLVDDGTRKYDPRRQTGRGVAATGAATATRPVPARKATATPRPAVAAAATAAATYPAREPPPTAAAKSPVAAAQAAAAIKPAAATEADLGAHLSVAAPRIPEARQLVAATEPISARQPVATAAAASAAKRVDTAEPTSAPWPAATAQQVGVATRLPAPSQPAAVGSAPNPTQGQKHRPARRQATRRSAARPEPRRTGPRHTGAEPAQRPPPGPPQRATSHVSRTIPAPLRRHIWRRDEGACTFVDPDTGHRCGSQHLLQIDHIQPFAMGGTASADNLRLLCEAHNRHRARKSFGTRASWGGGGGS